MMSLIQDGDLFFLAILEVLDESETLWETLHMLILMLIGFYSFIHFRLMATSLHIFITILSMFRTLLGSQQARCCAVVTCDLQCANHEQVFAGSDEERASNSQCLASD